MPSLFDNLLSDPTSPFPTDVNSAQQLASTQRLFQRLGIIKPGSGLKLPAASDGPLASTGLGPAFGQPAPRRQDEPMPEMPVWNPKPMEYPTENFPQALEETIKAFKEKPDTTDALEKAEGVIQRLRGERVPPPEGGGPQMRAPVMTPTQGPDAGDWNPNSDPNARGISANEGSGSYTQVGPVANKAGNRAYGKYQVMDFNIPSWTREVLGVEMNPQQFLADPRAQEMVFRAKFGQLVAKYGPVGASRAWFAGEGGMNNPSATDVNGMTVQRYGDQFARTAGVPQEARGGYFRGR